MQAQLLLTRQATVMERTGTMHTHSHIDTLSCSDNVGYTLSCAAYVFVVAFDLAVAVQQACPTWLVNFSSTSSARLLLL
jgi:hypothetical protein